jgi:hypothetical protein
MSATVRFREAGGPMFLEYDIASRSNRISDASKEHTAVIFKDQRVLQELLNHKMKAVHSFET